MSREKCSSRASAAAAGVVAVEEESEGKGLKRDVRD